MILMNLSVDNLCGFHNFEVDFSYPDDVLNSTIDIEQTSGKWFLCDLNGTTCIGYENWDASGYRSDGWGISIELVKYQGETISRIIADGFEASWGSVDDSESDYTWRLDAIGVSVSEKAIAFQKKTICEDYLHGKIFCTIKSDIMLDQEKWLSWFQTLQDGQKASDVIQVTDIAFSTIR